MNKTIDMNDLLNASLNASWPRSQGMKTISSVIGCAEGATSDWDEGAGEDWGRILIGQNPIAFVWMKGPLVIVVSDISEMVSTLRDKGLYVVAVPSMDSECLTADRTIVERFAGRAVSDAFNSNNFSPEDLVWATI